MKPNIPSSKVKAVLVDRNICVESIKLLIDKGIAVYKTTSLKNLNDCTATHPDMQFVKIDSNNVFVAIESLAYYKSILPEFNYIAVDGIKSPYPTDSKLNFTIVGDYAFAAKNHVEYIDGYKVIPIKQGYSKCNICILNENAIITSDKDILLKAEKFGFNSYYLPNDDISLSGYSCGFWGGCSGLIGKNEIFFNGNIEEISCYKDLISILEKEKIEPIYPTNVKLSDNGSIIPILD